MTIGYLRKDWLKHMVQQVQLQVKVLDVSMLIKELIEQECLDRIKL